MTDLARTFTRNAAVGGRAVSERPLSRRWRQADSRIYIGGAAILLVVLACVVLPHVAGFDRPNEQNYDALLQAPSGSHPMGTDQLGRDVFSRVLAGALLDLGVAVGLTVISAIIGILAGGVAGYFGRWIDAAAMRVVDVLISFPFILFVIVLVTIMGPGLSGVAIAAVTLGAAIFARLTRGEVLVLREQDFVRAARTLGLSQRRIVLLHVLPNAVRPTLAYVPASSVGNILLLASLSYLGLGVRPPRAELGAIISEGQQYIADAWWLTALPGVAILVIGLALSILAEGLERQLGRT